MKNTIVSVTIAFLCSAVCADDLLDSVLHAKSAPVTPQSAPSESVTKSDEITKGEDVEVPSGDTEEISALKAEIADLQSRIHQEVALPSGTESERLGHIERPTTLFVRGGGSSKTGSESSVLSAEWTKPLGRSDFDLAIRLGTFSFEEEVRKKEYYYTYTYSWLRGTRRHKHYRYYYEDEAHTSIRGDAEILWRPFRECTVSPYAGIGLGYETIQDPDDQSATLVGRIGVLFDFKRVFLLGEYVVSGECSELIGDFSFYLTRRMKLHAFVENGEIDAGKGTCFGGGLSFDF